MDRYVDELKFQKRIIDEVHELGGAGWKNSNAFMSSVPDLFFKLKDEPDAQIEAKSARPLLKSQIIQWKTTPLQQKMMKKLDEAGTVTGVVVVFGEALNKCRVGFFKNYTTLNVGMEYVFDHFVDIKDIKPKYGSIAHFIHHEYRRQA